MNVTVLFWAGLGFLLGSLPFSVWLGRLFLDTDVRRYGDGNPGAANAWRAGGWRLGLPASLLDYAKGALPVGLAHFNCGISGWGLAAVALAPPLGHAFSPFLRFRGGKAIATTFGIWTGLMLGEGPLILGLVFAMFYSVQSNDGLAVLLGMLTFGGYLLLRDAGFHTVSVWGGNTLLLAWKHRHELPRGMRPRAWVLKLLGRMR